MTPLETPLDQPTPSFTKRIHNVYTEQAIITNDFKAYVKSLDFSDEEIESFFNLALEVDDFTTIRHLSHLLDNNIHKIAVGDLKSSTYPRPSYGSLKAWTYEVNEGNYNVIKLDLTFNDDNHITSIRTSVYPY